MESAIGFSIMTSQPASISAEPTSQCIVVGVATTAQSISLARAATSSKRLMFSVAETSSATSSFGSTKPTTLASGISVRMRAWRRPR